MGGKSAGRSAAVPLGRHRPARVARTGMCAGCWPRPLVATWSPIAGAFTWWRPTLSHGPQSRARPRANGRSAHARGVPARVPQPRDAARGHAARLDADRASLLPGALGHPARRSRELAADYRRLCSQAAERAARPARRAPLGHFEQVDDELIYRIAVEYQPRPGWRGPFDGLLVRHAVERALRERLTNLDRRFHERSSRARLSDTRG